MERVRLSTLGFECRPDCQRDRTAALIQGLLQGSGRRCGSVLRLSASLGKELGLEKITQLDKLDLDWWPARQVAGA